MLGIFKKKKKEKCEHEIGNSNSEEVYVWMGKCPTPLKHYTTFYCSKCGEHCRIIHTDAIKNRVEDYY